MRRVLSTNKGILVNTQLTSNNSATCNVVSKPSPGSVELAAQFALVMESRYGSAWSSRMDSPAKMDVCLREWGAVLIEFPQTVLDTAMNRSLREYVKFPPTLPEFLALCRACSPNRPGRARR